MADDGYLIGYEDNSGNFVEVGRFNNLNQNTSDPVFIEHTGSGTRMELDGSGFDMNGNDITNAASVNNVKYVKPGNVTTPLGNGDDAIVLGPGQYTTPIKPAEGSHVIFAKAEINKTSFSNTSDPGLDLSNGGVRISGQLQIFAGNVSGPAVLIDAQAKGDDIRLQQSNNIMGGEANIIVSQGFNSPAGSALTIRAGGGNNVALGTRLNIMSVFGQDGIRLITNDGSFINGPQINTHIRSYHGRAIVHDNNSGSAGRASTEITGRIQADSASDHAIENKTSAPSITFNGRLFDPTNSQVSAVTGPNLRIKTKNGVSATFYDFNSGTVINGLARQASNGTPTQQGRITGGDIVEDTSNSNFYLRTPAQNFVQIN